MRRLSILILCLILPSCLMAQGMVTLGLLGGGALIYETMQGEEAPVRAAWTAEASAGYLFRLGDSVLLGPQASVVWTGRTNIVERSFYAASLQGLLPLPRRRTWALHRHRHLRDKPQARLPVPLALHRGSGAHSRTRGQAHA